MKNLLQIDFDNKERKATAYPGFANFDVVGHQITKL